MEREYLDSIYHTLYDSAMALEASLVSGGFDCDWGWFNYTSPGSTGGFCYYPVPVISVNGFGSVSLDISSWDITAVYPKSVVAAFPFPGFGKKHRFVLYAADESSDGDTEIIADEKSEYIYEAIMACSAERVCLCIHRAPDCGYNAIREVLAELRTQNRHHGSEEHTI